MAVNNELLLTSLVLSEVFVDPLTLQPLIGEVFFFKTDKITVKNIYQLTGDDLDPFEVAPNPFPLQADGGFLNKIYYYPYDEDDETTVELYYIEARRTDTSVVLTFDDFPKNFVPRQGGTASSEELSNLLPSYGFDIPINRGFFTQDNEFPIEGTTLQRVTVAPGFDWIISNPSFSKFFYSFSKIAQGTLDGDPLYEITLDVESFGTAQTTLLFGGFISLDNQLAGETINLQVFVQDKSGAAITSLNVVVYAADSYSPTTVTTLPVTTSLVQNKLSFTMPTVDLDSFDNRQVYLGVELPNAQELSIAFTGWFAYRGVAQTNLTILPQPLGEDISDQFFSTIDKDLRSVQTDSNDTGTTYLGNELPLSATNGTIAPLSHVGEIFEAGLAQSFDNAVLLSGDTIIINQLIGEKKDILTNRYLADSPLSSKGGNSFVISNVLATAFDVETLVAGKPHTTWVSNTANVVITTNTGGAIPLSAVIGAPTNTVDITFNNDYLAFIKPQIFYKQFNEQPNIESFPADNVINNWIGNLNTSGSITFNFNLGNVGMLTTANGSPSTAATCTVTFPVGGTTANLIKSFVSNHDYGNVYMNYFSFLDVAINPPGTDMPTPPPFSISFHVDDDGIEVPATIHPYVMNFATSDLATGDLMAIAFNNFINTATKHTITINGLPLNGDNVQASTHDADFVFIFHDTAQAQPANPFPSKPPVFVLFTTSDTIVDFIDTFSRTFTTKLGSIPSINDLNYPKPPDLIGKFIKI